MVKQSKQISHEQQSNNLCKTAMSITEQCDACYNSEIELYSTGIKLISKSSVLYIIIPSLKNRSVNIHIQVSVKVVLFCCLKQNHLNVFSLNIDLAK